LVKYITTLCHPESREGIALQGAGRTQETRRKTWSKSSLKLLLISDKSAMRRQAKTEANLKKLDALLKEMEDMAGPEEAARTSIKLGIHSPASGWTSP